MTMGVGNGDVLGQAFWLGGKRGKIVVTNIHPTAEASIAVPAAFLTLFEKQLIGSLFGSANPRKDIPKLLELYTQGQLDLDGLVTTHLSARGDQRRLRRHERRQEHPRRAGVRLSAWLTPPLSSSGCWAASSVASARSNWWLPRWRPTGTCCWRAHRAPARARCCAPSPTSSASVSSSSRATPS